MENNSPLASSPLANSPLAGRHSALCLGMCNWTECPCQPLTQPTTPTRPSFQASLPPTISLQESHESQESQESLLLHQPSKRFKFESDDKLAEMARGFTPENTSKATKWSLRVLEQWKAARNKQYPNETVPEDLLESSDPQFLNTHLSRFAVELRKVNGDKYPPSTIHQLLCGLLRHMRNSNPGCPNFLDKQDSRFKPLQGTLDYLFHSLHSEGVGVQVKHAEIVSKEEEAKLWNSEIMGLSSPLSLQNAAFFVVGKFFALRGGVEHRNLQLSQLKRMCAPDKYVYYENVAKNSSGSFKKLHVKPKAVPLYSCQEAGDRCPVN